MAPQPNIFGFRALPVIAAALLVFAGVPRAHPATRVASESEIKAVLLFHLTQYITWPHGLTNAASFTIGICGPDPFGAALDDVVANERVAGKPINVIRTEDINRLSQCGLVYISPDYRRSLGGTLAALHRGQTLTVGESATFVERGGMVAFKRTQERKVRLEVALDRVRQHGLNISAQLLRVCDVIATREDR